MNAHEIREQVLRVLGEVAPDADLGSLDPKAPLQEALDLDSMDFLNVVSGIQQYTGIDVPERDYPKIATLDDCVAYLESMLAAA